MLVRYLISSKPAGECGVHRDSDSSLRQLQQRNIKSGQLHVQIYTTT